MQERQIILENAEGKIVRTFRVKSEDAVVIARKDTRRLEIVSDIVQFTAQKIEFTTLAKIQNNSFDQGPIKIADFGYLKLNSENLDVIQNVKLSDESNKHWPRIFASVAAISLALLIFVLARPEQSAKIEAELKQQVVTIMKKIQLKPHQSQVANTNMNQQIDHNVKTTKTQDTLKRMGALAVLGSLKSGAQKGGLNLGAVNTTAGPGLGGNAGSGGVQTSLYGKGLVSAPLGAGANLQGGGGYGTKGKGGGQAGYGSLSLVGSTGANPIPLGKEAIVGGGLDKDLIAAVINRNLGQVRFCYEQGLQGDPALAGRVAVGFTIGGNGTVKIADVENTSLNSKLVEDCILLRLKTWKFPLPEGGVDVKVSYPFVLRRSSNG